MGMYAGVFPQVGGGGKGQSAMNPMTNPGMDPSMGQLTVEPGMQMTPSMVPEGTMMRQMSESMQGFNPFGGSIATPQAGLPTQELMVPPDLPETKNPYHTQVDKIKIPSLKDLLYR